MKVLASVRWILSPLISPPSHGPIFLYFTIWYLLSSVLLIVPTVIEIAENINDLTKVTQSLYRITLWSLGFAKYVSFVRHKQIVGDVFESLQVIVNGSEWQ